MGPNSEVVRLFVLAGMCRHAMQQCGQFTVDGFIRDIALFTLGEPRKQEIREAWKRELGEVALTDGLSPEDVQKLAQQHSYEEWGVEDTWLAVSLAWMYTTTNPMEVSHLAEFGKSGWLRMTGSFLDLAVYRAVWTIRAAAQGAIYSADGPCDSLDKLFGRGAPRWQGTPLHNN